MAVVTITDAAPTVADPAAAMPSTVAGTTTTLSVLGADADGGGESNLTYTWAATGLPTGASPPTFSVNGTHAAQNTTATFSQAGSYQFTATITDLGGLSTTSSVNVNVSQTLTGITVSPATANVGSDQTQQFAAVADDQFGAAMANQPAFTWSVLSGAGSIDASGLYTASYASGSASVQAQAASSGINSNAAVVTITDAAPTVANPAAAMPSTVADTTTTLSVLGADADGGGEANLTYAWAATVLPTGASPPTFNVNGTHAAQNTAATFSQAGSYQLTVTITDLGGLSATSSVSVTVNQTLTTVSLAGLPLAPAAFDQFGNPLANQPEIDAGSDTITGPLELDSDVTVLPVAGTPLTISGGISGAGGLTIGGVPGTPGQGTVILSGANSYTGGTTVCAGTLVLTQSSAIAAGTSLTIGADATSIFNSSLAATPSALVAAASPAIVAHHVPMVAANTTASSHGTSSVASHDTTLATGSPLTAGQATPRQFLQFPSKSHPSVALNAPAADQFFRSSTAKRFAVDLSWLRQSSDSSDNSDQHHKKDATNHALDAMFARYR